MNPHSLVSIRVITEDVERLVGFYEHVTGLPAHWSTPDFAELEPPVGTLAIGSTRTVGLFGAGSARAADNHTAEYERIKLLPTEFVNAPTTMPWGNRSLLLRDPDGNLVNLFTPVTPDARSKFDRSGSSR